MTFEEINCRLRIVDVYKMNDINVAQFVALFTTRIRNLAYILEGMAIVTLSDQLRIVKLSDDETFCG